VISRNMMPSFGQWGIVRILFLIVAVIGCGVWGNVFLAVSVDGLCLVSFTLCWM